MTWVFVLVGVGLVVLVAIGVVVIIYNGLVRARNAYRNSFGQIDVQLTRRHDLIPNLVETAKGYLRHERGTLEVVVRARTAAVSAQSAVAGKAGTGAALGVLAGAENLLTQALGQMFALAEGYPDLKANQSMLRLQEELTTTENRVAFARQAYNDAVMTYNTKRQVFPSSLIAGIFSFRPAELFEIDDPLQRQAPDVSF